MSSKYGVNVELRNGSLTPYTIENSRPIAIVGDTKSLENGISIYSTVDDALEVVKTGSLSEALQDLKATGLHTQVILSAFTKPTTQEDNTAVLEAIDNLKRAESKVMAKPKFILAPDYNDTGVYEKLKQVAQSLRAVYAIELNATDETSALQQVDTLQFKTAIVSYQKVKRIDKKIRPASVFLIASYAKVMALSEYGFSETYSNKTIDGIVALDSQVEYIQGEDCEADRLRKNGITALIVDDGIRAWGGEIRDDDFTSLHTYVIFYTAIDTIFEAQKRAIDKRMRDVLKNIVDSLEAFYRRLQTNNVIVGSKVEVPLDLNTNQTIAEGIVYIKHNVQEMPLVKNITNKIYRVDTYSQVLVEEL